jgi:hypothetical protein
VLATVLLAACGKQYESDNERTPQSDAELAGLNAWWLSASAADRLQVCTEWNTLDVDPALLAEAAGFTDAFQLEFFLNEVC